MQALAQTVNDNTESKILVKSALNLTIVSLSQVFVRRYFWFVKKTFIGVVKAVAASNVSRSLAALNVCQFIHISSVVAIYCKHIDYDAGLNCMMHKGQKSFFKKNTWFVRGKNILKYNMVSILNLVRNTGSNGDVLVESKLRCW